MAVTVLISENEDAAPLIGWGAQFARARHLPLVVLVLQHKRTEAGTLDLASIPEGDALLERIGAALADVREKYQPKPLAEGEEAEVNQSAFEPICRLLPGKNGFVSVIAELRLQKARLLMIGKQRKLPGDDPVGQLVHELFRRAPCDTLLLRTGSNTGEEIKRIVVPAAGGQHAPIAIGWAADVVMENDALCVPLYVEPQMGSESDDVGIYHLQTILKKAQIEVSEWIKPRVEIAPSPTAGMRAVVEEGCDLILVGASEKGTVRRMMFGTLPQKLLEAGDGTAVGVMRRSRPLTSRVRDRIEDWLDMRIPQLDRQERIALFDRLQSGSRWDFDFLAMMSLATIIASLGLLQNSAAVVIGAMLVAPLMTPLIGMGLSLVQANWLLMRQAGRAVAYGFLLAVFLGFFTGLLHPVAEITGELASRGQPNVFDLAIALFSGIAAAYALARPNLSAALPGVAIAAALVPPLATIGIALAFGSYRVALGSTMLFASNLTAIILGSAFVFHACGVHGSAENGRGAIWTRRVVMSLLAVCVFLTIPLGTRVLKRATEFRRHRTLSTSSYEALQTVFAHDGEKPAADSEKWDDDSWPNPCEVSTIRIVSGGATPTIEITVLGSSPPNSLTVNKAAKICSDQLHRPVSLRVITRLVQTSQATPED